MGHRVPARRHRAGHRAGHPQDPQGRPGVGRRRPEGHRRCRRIDRGEPGGEGGLLGIAVSPEYATDKTVFVYYTTETDNRVAKLMLGGKPTADRHRHPALGHPQRRPAARSARTASSTPHRRRVDQGGRAQDPKSLGGKILRMTTDGKPAPGNPFAKTRWSGRTATATCRASPGTRPGAAVRHRVRPEHVGRGQRDPAGQELRLADGRGHRRRTRASSTRWSPGRPTESSCSGAAMLGAASWSRPACAGSGCGWSASPAPAPCSGAPMRVLDGEYGRLRAAGRRPGRLALGHHVQPGRAGRPRRRTTTGSSGWSSPSGGAGQELTAVRTARPVTGTGCRPDDR